MTDDREHDELSALARARSARVEAELAEVRERRGAYADVPARDEAANARLVGMLAAQLAARAPSTAKVVPLRRWRAPLAGLAVAAAALLLVVRLSNRGEVPLAPYELFAETGLSTLRGEPARPGVVPRLVLERTQELLLVARPELPIQGPFRTHASIEAGGRELPWKGTVEPDASGAVRLSAPLVELVPPEVSEFEVIVRIGRPDALAHSLAGDAPADPAALHELRIRVLVTPP